MNSDDNRAHTDALLNRNIIIPVWNDHRGQGSHFDYQVAKFAVVSLTDYQYSGKGYISFIFKRYTRCYNIRPVAQNQSITTPEDTPIVISLLATDENGDSLQYEILTEPQQGVIEVLDNQVTYTPTENYNGPDSLVFIVNDGEQLSNTATVSIDVTPVNDPPVADDKTASGLEDTPIPLTFSGSDIEQTPLEFSPATQPQHGTLTQVDGRYAYQPNPDYFGPDSFTYIANDGELDSQPANYVITVVPVNDPPTAQDITAEVESGIVLPITLLGDDIDSKNLQYRVLSQPEDGSLGGEDAQLTYQSTPFYDGVVTFTYSVSDGELESAPATVTITVIYPNEPPVITNPPLTVTPEQQYYDHQVLADDPNQDPLTYSLDFGPQGMSINPNDGSMSWLPQDSYVQSVPTFNKQCYIVPTGATKLYEEGDEVNSQVYIAPLFHRVRTAIKNAGIYTAREAISWHQRKNCLGCHVQNQSLLGLQASKDKAEIDEAAANYLLTEILASQQSDGTIRRSHPEYAKTQTAFALWALNQVPERELTYEAREHALAYFWERRQSNGQQLYWSQDHDTGWLNNTDAMTMLIAQSAARFIAESTERETLTSNQQTLVENYSQAASGITEFVLARAFNNEDQSLLSAFRLVTLAELVPLLANQSSYDQIQAAIDHLDSLLRQRQEQDGGWNRYASGAVGDPLTSAWVGIALNYQKPAITDPAIIANIEYLLDNQSPSGTWVTNSGLFSTHLATTSLVMAYLPVALEHLGNPDVRVGHIQLQQNDSGIHQLSVEITNRGLADITAPVKVTFYNGDPQMGDLLGAVSLNALTSGVTLKPNITVDDQRLNDDVHVVLSVSDKVEECQITNNNAVAALVRLRVTDPGQLFDTQVFTLNVDDVNQAPVIDSQPVIELQAGQSFDYRVETSDADNGDAHSFTLISGPEGLFIDPRTGKFTSAPGALAAGSYQITVEVEDLRGATTQQTFTLTVYQNLSPQIISDALIRGEEHSAYQYDVEATDPNPGDLLRYQIEQGPEELAVDINSGLIDWVKTQGFIDNRVDSNTMCMAEPVASTGQFEPVLKWHWSGSSFYSAYNQVMAMPVVAQLNDDNSDGEINSKDTPDVIFSTFRNWYYRNPGILRAVSGKDGKEIWSNTTARWATPMFAPAVGDIDGDGLVEVIVGSGYYNGSKTLIVYENDGRKKYERSITHFGAPILADLEGDGQVEIVMSGIVYDAVTGQELWRTARRDSKVLALDLDLDGKQEVFASGQAYDHQGNMIWDASSGYSAAVGNFDSDDYPEIAVKHDTHTIKLLEHDGSVKWGPVSIPGNGGGPLTIADIDGDGEPEIGVAGANYYVAFEADGTVKWKSKTKDWSSQATGSSVFDFEGDGKAEILYGDEHYFRVYEGETGTIKLQIPNPSGTLFEYPLVVDVDNDNHAEIVVVSNNYNFSGTTGIRVFEDINDSWAPTRAIWNQHAYSINNVNDDGTIPANPTPSWLTHNTFRLNTFADREALALPDLTVHSITFDEDSNTLSAKVKNRGLAPVTKPTIITFTHEHFWSGDEALGQQTVPPLAAGEEVIVSLEVANGDALINSIRADLTTADDVTECLTDNNSSRAAIVDVRVFDPAGLSDSQKFALSVADTNDSPVISSSAASTAPIGSDFYTFTVTVEDPDKGDTFAFELVDAPEGISIHPRTGKITLTDLAEAVYSFTIRATDLSGAVAEQRHVLTVTTPDNQPPVISSEPTPSVAAGQTYRYDVDATDPDGDAVVYFFSRSQPGMTIDGVSGQINWTPTAADIGLKPVEVIALDPQGAYSRQYFLIEVIDPDLANQPPVISSVPSGSVYAGQVFSYQVMASDPDGDALSYALINDVVGMSISAQGLLTWLPDASLIGQTQIVELVVSDGRGGNAIQKLTLPVNEAANNPPIITSLPIQQTTVDQPYLYRIAATDADGDSIQLSLDQAPNGMHIDGNQVSWTPSAVQAEVSHDVVVRATDSRGSASLQRFNIFVNAADAANSAPQIDSTPQSPALVDQQYRYQLIARDADGDVLSYSLENAPIGMTINAQGLLQWTPTSEQVGTHAISIRVTDGKAAALQSYHLQAVEDLDNQFPQISSRPLTTAVVGYDYRSQIVASDPDGDLLSFGTTVQPEGMNVSAEGLVEWTPLPDQVGSHEVTLFADDGQGRALQTFTIQVTEKPLPLAVTILVTPPYPAEGDTVSIDIFSEGGLGATEASLQVDGLNVPLNSFGQAQVVASGIGSHEIIATVTDQQSTTVQTASFSVRDETDTTAPLVSFISPEFDSRITAPVDVIATVEDDNLTRYRVLVSPKGQQRWQQIGEGSTNITEGVVASFDPTLLVNGQYDLIVQAEDVNGQTSSDGVVVLVDGDLKVGNFSVTFEDLNIPVAGIPIRVTRTYDSRRRFESLDFGYGWSVGYQDVKVEESRTPGKFWEINEYRSGPYGVYADFCIEPQGAPVVSVTLPTGDVERFEAAASPSCNSYQVVKDVKLVFNAVGDTQSQLEALDSVNARYEGGTLLETGSFSGPVNPTRYKLTTRTGYIYLLNQDLGIEQVIDPNGHTLTYSNDGIVHSSGKSVDFVRDSQGRITLIVDPNGNILNYGYDAAQNLSLYSDTGQNDTSFTYNSNHGLLDIIDPLGRTLVRNIYDDDGRLIAQDDSDGNRTEFNHDITGRQSVITDRLGRTSFLYYDDMGNVTSRIDPLGQRTNFTYDERGNQLSKTDPLGNVTTATFNASNDQLTQTDGEGNTVSFSYNTRGQELTITDAKSQAYTNVYDSVGNLLSVTDPDGNIAGNNIDANGHVSLSQDVLGHTTSYTYDADGNKLTETNHLGEVVHYSYDANGNVLSETRARTLADGLVVDDVTVYTYDAQNRVIKTQLPDGSVQHSEYDALGNQTAAIDSLQRRTEYDYDVYGRLLETRYPDGTFSRSSYDAEGNKLTDTDRLGHTTHYGYDDLNRLLQTIYPDGSVISTEYDEAGRVSAEIDANNNRTEYNYDRAGRRILSRNALAQEHRFGYDQNGNLISETDALGHTTSYSYNALDQRTETRFDNASTLADTLDALGRRTAQADQANISTQYRYDALGRLTSVTDALSGETHYSYDEAGNKLTQTDAEGRTTRWEYDSLGRVTARILPMGQRERFVYDAAGQLVEQTDFNGNTRHHRYDSNGRLTRTDYHDGSAEAFSYDAEGNRLSAGNAEGTWLYRYDSRNRLIQETQPNGNQLHYAYDANGNRTRLQVIDGGANVLLDQQFGYDVLNRLESVTDVRGTTSYGYDQVGNRSSISYANGTSTTYVYDNLNRLEQISHYGPGGALLSRFSYNLDATGRRTGILEANGRDSQYSYDQLYRLVSEQITDPVNGDYNATYQYDKVGNRDYQTIDGVSTSYVYDDNDRLTQQGGTFYSYDDNGNTLSVTEGGLVTRYSYDADNKLVSLNKAGIDTRFGYNPDGIRISKSEAGDTTEYTVDSNRDYAQVLVEAGTSHQILYRYGDDLISQEQGGEEFFFHYDGLGSTRSLTDESGNLSDSFGYEAFGGLLNRTGSTENSYQFAGEQFDPSLGQYYLRARYYDQEVGRFRQQDLFEGWDDDPITLNKYLYANSDPSSYIDPTGKFGFGLIAPSGISSQIQSTSIAVGVSSFARIAVGLFASGTIAYGVNDSYTTMLANSAAAQKMLELERGKLESKVTESSKGRGDLVYHYTDRVAARAIMAMQCGFASKWFKHPDGLERPPGIYATLLHPWISGWTQTDLRSVLYAKPRNQDVSYFVAMESTGFLHLGVESYKPGPRGSCVPVTAVYTGANLMMPK
ncbi:Ig-like domain-containing protein [Motiliproteus coralliicola]|nr:Ig-like domain-containing protein [Motiliproteus coralliicola]